MLDNGAQFITANFKLTKIAQLMVGRLDSPTVSAFFCLLTLLLLFAFYKLHKWWHKTTKGLSKRSERKYSVNCPSRLLSCFYFSRSPSVSSLSYSSFIKPSCFPLPSPYRCELLFFFFSFCQIFVRYPSHSSKARTHTRSRGKNVPLRRVH